MKIVLGQYVSVLPNLSTQSVSTKKEWILLKVKKKKWFKLKIKQGGPPCLKGLVITLLNVVNAEELSTVQ